MAQHELIKPAEYARRRGVTRAAVSKAILRCRIPLIEGKLDPLVADTLWQARTDPDQQKRALGQNRDQAPPSREVNAPPGESYDEVRRRRELAEMRLAELELQEREGLLVKAADVEQAGSRLASAIVQKLEAIPERIAAEFGADDESRGKLRRRLREEIDRVRDEFVRAEMLAA